MEDNICCDMEIIFSWKRWRVSIPLPNGQPTSICIYAMLVYGYPLPHSQFWYPGLRRKHNPWVASNSHPGTPLLRWRPPYVRLRASLLRKCGGDHGSDGHWSWSLRDTCIVPMARVLDGLTTRPIWPISNVPEDWFWWLRTVTTFFTGLIVLYE